MRRKWHLIVVALMALLLAATARAGHETYLGYPVVHIMVNGKPLQTDVPAVVLAGRTVLPVRPIAELMGFDVAFDGPTGTVHLTAPSQSSRELQEARQLISALQAQVSSLAAERDALKRQSGGELSAEDVRVIKSMPSADFQGLLKERFGKIGGLPLRLSVSDDLITFSADNGSAWTDVDYLTQLHWSKSLAGVLDARFEGKPFSAQLIIRLEFSSVPTSYPPEEIDFSVSSGKWVVRHSVISIRRSDLGAYGLQPLRVEMRE